MFLLFSWMLCGKRHSSWNKPSNAGMWKLVRLFHDILLLIVQSFNYHIGKCSERRTFHYRILRVSAQAPLFRHFPTPISAALNVLPTWWILTIYIITFSMFLLFNWMLCGKRHSSWNKPSNAGMWKLVLGQDGFERWVYNFILVSGSSQWFEIFNIQWFRQLREISNQNPQTRQIDVARVWIHCRITLYQDSAALIIRFRQTRQTERIRLHRIQNLKAKYKNRYKRTQRPIEPVMGKYTELKLTY